MPTNYPRDGVNAIVAALRTLPDFLDTVSDPNKIQAYQDAFPQSSSWGKAIRDMPIPGVLVAYQGTDYGAFGGIQTDIHHFVVVMRAKFEDAIGPDMTRGYYRMIDGLVNGVPNLGALPDPPANQAGQKMRAINGLVPSCHAMTRPSIERLSDAEGLDYFQAILSFPQAGDF